MDRFRALVEGHLGLSFDQGAGAEQLRKVLALRTTAHELDCEAYLEYLEAGQRSELEALGEGLTVGETYFLRHVEQFRALTRTVIPELLRRPGRDGPLQVLSAGCASGEEAYSLAIALHEGGASSSTSILGVDLNPAALEKAIRGRYTTWSLRSVPDAVRRRWFTTVGNDVQLAAGIRDRVRFQQHNLAEDDPGLWQPDTFDVVFCRNVLMYFAPEMMARVIERIARSLTPGGYLFLGSAETLRGVPCDFQFCQSHGAFYYRRRKPLIPATEGSHPALDLSALLPHSPQPPPIHQPPSIDQPAVHDLDRALSLLRQERFAEALAAVDELPGTLGEPSADPGLLLLRATLLTHSGSYPAAEAAAHRLLQLDEFSACAHALLATCRESEGDVQGAVGHYRTAISHDPGFAMVHLQLARLTGLTGDRDRAGQEYAAAARLLPGETDHRILLFGGGFDRDALISLCRSQCAGAGGDR